MKKIKLVILGAMATLILSCSEKKEFNIKYKGYIDEGDWVSSQTIGEYGGYTGSHCSKVDSINQYSWGLKKVLNEIDQNPIKKVKVSLWVKLQDLNKKTKLVVAVSDKNKKSILWVGRDVNDVVKEVNKWYKFETEETLPEYEDGATIEIYLFNPNKNIAFVDDVEMNFIGE
jgi:hypothetical protein